MTRPPLLCLTVVAALAGCDLGEPSLDGRECPCVRGYVCNETTDRCLPEVRREFVPSLVGTSADRAHGRSDLVAAPGEHWLLDTDNGAVQIYDAADFSGDPTRTERAPGDEPVANGIGFQLEADGSFGVFTFGSLHVRDGASVVAVGSRPAVLLSAESIVVEGLLSAGAERVPNLPGAGGGQGAMPSWATMPDPGGSPVPGGGGGTSRGAGSGASHGGCGGVGGNPVAFAPGQASEPYVTSLGPEQLVGGAGGGSGGAGSNRACSGHTHAGLRGGHGGGALAVIASERIFVGATGVVDARGGGGSGGVLPAAATEELFDLASGSGGGSGGAVLLEAPLMQVTGAVTANGGAGGGGAGGDPGEDGVITFPDDFRAGEPGEHGRTDASPAAGGAGMRGAGVGGDGSDDLGCGANGEAGERAGGGGGGAGVIYLRTATEPSLALEDAVLSPSRASGLAVVTDLGGALPRITPRLGCTCPAKMPPPLAECF